MQKLPFLASLAFVILWGAAQSHATINTNCIAQKPKVVCNIAWREGAKQLTLNRFLAAKLTLKSLRGNEPWRSKMRLQCS